MEVFAEGEDALALRLANKLADLRAEYATSFVHTHEWVRIEHVDKKEQTTAGGQWWRYSPRAKMLTSFALKASFQIFRRSMRTPSCIRTNGIESNT